MSGMLKQVQKMQQKMAEAQALLEELTVTGEAGGGVVKVTANGKQSVRRVEISPEVVDPTDVPMLEDLVLTAVNRALEESARIAQAEMEKATQGMLPNIPGMRLPGF
jgi:DNA-binding YbaB/EbfC family protein